MGWLTDWLIPDTRPAAGIRGRPVSYRCHPDEDARSTLDKLAGVPTPTYTECSACGHGGNGQPCKCGGPSRWWET
jgi:hypothetical protein